MIKEFPNPFVLKATWKGVLWDIPPPQPADVKKLCQESTGHSVRARRSRRSLCCVNADLDVRPQAAAHQLCCKQKVLYKLLTCKLSPRRSCTAAEPEAALARGAAPGLLLTVQSWSLQGARSRPRWPAWKGKLSRFLYSGGHCCALRKFPGAGGGCDVLQGLLKDAHCPQNICDGSSVSFFNPLQKQRV